MGNENFIPEVLRDIKLINTNNHYLQLTSWFDQGCWSNYSEKLNCCLHLRTSPMLQNLAKFDKVFPYQTHLFGLTSDSKQEISWPQINQQYFWKIFIRESLSKIGTRHWISCFKPGTFFTHNGFQWVISINVSRCQLCFLKIAPTRFTWSVHLSPVAQFILSQNMNKQLL